MRDSSGRSRFLLTACLGIGLAVSNGSIWAQAQKSKPDQEPPAGCGTFDYRHVRERVGPVDYRVATEYIKLLVENAHFTRSVELLRRGKSSTLGGDIAYTLNAFPNHPRALRSAAEYERRRGPEAVRDMGFSTQCWFERAVAFRTADANVRIVVANELIKRGQKEQAREHLTVAEQSAGGHVGMLYNLGLLYFDLGDYDRSLVFAKQAYSLGIDLPGLRQKLTRAGKWQD